MTGWRVFQPALPAWRATGADKAAVIEKFIFQPALPAWRATYEGVTLDTLAEDFNPRSPRGERQKSQPFCMHERNFNPRSPRGERPRYHFIVCWLKEFQPALPAWRATKGMTAKGFAEKFQPALPAWRATGRVGRAQRGIEISTRAPRVESDRYRPSYQQ